MNAAKSGRLGRALVYASAVTIVAGSGCARVVVLDPQSAAMRSDVSWSIKRRPRQPVVVREAAAQQTTGDSTPEAGAPQESTSPPATAVGAPATSRENSAPLFRMRTDVQLALRSPPDALGIPVALYALDPLLTSFRQEMDSQAQARHLAATGSFALAAISGLVAALSFSVANRPSTPMQSQDSADFSLMWGVATATTCIVEVAAGIALLAQSSNATPLRDYYTETYGTP